MGRRKPTRTGSSGPAVVARLLNGLAAVPPASAWARCCAASERGAWGWRRQITKSADLQAPGGGGRRPLPLRAAPRPSLESGQGPDGWQASPRGSQRRWGPWRQSLGIGAGRGTPKGLTGVPRPDCNPVSAWAGAWDTGTWMWAWDTESPGRWRWWRTDVFLPKGPRFPPGPGAAWEREKDLRDFGGRGY